MNTDTTHPAFIAAVIIAVLAFTAALALGMWRMFRRVERAERDPKYLRRQLRRVGWFYVLAALSGIALVVSGNEPKEALIGLPIVALFIWTFFRAASRVKIPPE
jgi:hypothetical protein